MGQSLCRRRRTGASSQAAGIAADTTTAAAIAAATAEPAPPALVVGAPAVKAKAKAKPTAQPKRWYAVTSAPAGAIVELGIHRAQWTQLAARLPGGRLFGSSCKLSGHDTADAASEAWTAAGWSLPAPLVVYP